MLVDSKKILLGVRSRCNIGTHGSERRGGYCVELGSPSAGLYGLEQKSSPGPLCNVMKASASSRRVYQIKCS